MKASNPNPHRAPGQTSQNSELASHQTIPFTTTKNHVEYLGGYRVSMIYGSLDQTANREQLNLFHTKPTPWSSQIWPPEGLTSKSSKM